MPTEKFANLIATPVSDTDDNGVITTTAEALDASETGVDVAGSAPTALRNGQFRIRIDNEIMLVTTGQDTTTWTVTRGAEGTTAATHSSGAKVRHVLTRDALAGVARLSSAAAPWQHSFLGWNFDPQMANAQTSSPSGFVFCQKVWLPEPVEHTNVHFYVYTAGSSLTAGQCKAGIYNSAGTLISQSADLSAVVTSTGLKTVAQTAESGQALPTGGPGVYVRVALLMVGTTVPQLLQSSMASINEPVNVNLSGTGLKQARNGGGSSSLPANDSGITTMANQHFWVAVS